MVRVISRKSFLALSILVGGGLSGCSSTLSDEPLSYEHPIINKDVENTLPDWVLTDGDSLPGIVGVGCKEFNYSERDRISAREVAYDRARMALFKKLGGNDILYAREALEQKGDSVNYSTVIKTKSYGRIGRNEVLREASFVSNGLSQYCVAASLVV